MIDFRQIIDQTQMSSTTTFRHMQFVGEKQWSGKDIWKECVRGETSRYNPKDFGRDPNMH